MKGVFIFLADGFEDIEALATRDVLKRGGVDVKLVSITDEPFVQSSHGVCVGTDCILSDLLSGNSSGMGTDESDFFIFPGGMPGSKNLGNCSTLIALMNEHYAQGGSVAAICAAPNYVLGQLKGMENATFTCYDGNETELVKRGAKYVLKPAVSCGRIVTGRSAGYAVEFGEEILVHIKGAQETQKVHDAMFRPCAEPQRERAENFWG